MVHHVPRTPMNTPTTTRATMPTGTTGAKEAPPAAFQITERGGKHSWVKMCCAEKMSTTHCILHVSEETKCDKIIK